MTPPPRNRVLLVDDEEVLRRTVGNALRSAGYCVELAENGSQGLSRHLENPCHIIIADRAMPEMDGQELAAAIKAQGHGVPVILMTGLLLPVTNPDDFVAVLKKPFRMKDLLGLVAAAISISRH